MKMNTQSPAEARVRLQSASAAVWFRPGQDRGRGHKGSFARAGGGKIKAGFRRRPNRLISVACRRSGLSRS